MSSINIKIRFKIERDANGNVQDVVDLNSKVAWAKLFGDLEFISDGTYDKPGMFKALKEKLQKQTPPKNLRVRYNFMVVVNLNDRRGETFATCLLKMGYALAKRAGLNLGEKHLASVFPGGYALVNHYVKKGNKKRKDTYVYGHPSGKHYRSMDEFAIHFAHLYFDYDGPTNIKRRDCTCCLCDKTKATTKTK